MFKLRVEGSNIVQIQWSLTRWIFFEIGYNKMVVPICVFLQHVERFEISSKKCTKCFEVFVNVLCKSNVQLGGKNHI